MEEDIVCPCIEGIGREPSINRPGELQHISNILVMTESLQVLGELAV
jgi:hypothetical protein